MGDFYKGKRQSLCDQRKYDIFEDLKKIPACLEHRAGEGKQCKIGLEKEAGTR